MVSPKGKEPDFEIEDMENYTPEQEMQFSHQILVMKVMNKCVELGCKELHSGWMDEKEDRKGNRITVYHEDSRKSLIEGIKTAEMIMIGDMDEVATKGIKKIKDGLKEKYQELCEKESEDWFKTPIILKHQRWNEKIYWRKGYLNIHLPFVQEYLEFEVDAYREIFKELTKLTHRLGFYAKEKMVA